MEHESIGWTKPSVVHRARLFLRRKPLLAGVLGVLALAVIAASVAFHSYRIRDTRVHAYESSGHDYAMSLIRHLEAQRQANAHADRMITMTLALDLLVRSGFLGDVLSEDLTSEELLKITRFEYELAPENTVTRGLWGLMRSALALTVNEYEAQDIEDARALRLELEGYLPIHDPLLRQAEALIHAHSAKSLYFLTEQGRPLSKAGIEYAAHTAEQLENLLEDLDDAFGSTILKGALRSLEMLYSSKMLDDAECANHYKDLREGMTAPLGGRFNLSPQSDP